MNDFEPISQEEKEDLQDKFDKKTDEKVLRMREEKAESKEDLTENQK